MDFCAGTCLTVKACMLLGQRRTFAGGDLDLNVLRAAGLDLLLTFVSEAMNPNSEITGDEECEWI